MRWSAVVLLVAWAPADAAEERLRLERSDPEHKPALMRPITKPSALAPRTQFIRPQVVYNLPDGLEKLAKPDQKLSDLCRRGSFVQQTDKYYWARTKDRSYGVAFATGYNLIDGMNKRKPGKVYFFDDQDARCTVYVGDEKRLMKHYVGP